MRLLVVLALLSVAAASVSSERAAPIKNFCQGCRSLISFTRVFNSSSNRAEYKDVFRRYCELYYPVSTDYQSGPCPLFVEGLYYVLDHTDPITHCDQIGACEPSNDKALLPSDDIYEYTRQGNAIQPTRGDNVICEFCEQIVKQVKDILSDPEMIKQIKLQADSICVYLKALDMEKQCRHYIDNYLDQAIDFVRHVDSKQYCSAIQLCPPKTPNTESSATKLPTLADFDDFGIETSITIGDRPPITDRPPLILPSSATSHKAGAVCHLCLYTVKKMFHFLGDNKTTANVMKGLNEICDVVYRPGGLTRDQCSPTSPHVPYVVRAYPKELVQLLIGETDPNLICTLLSQCTYDNKIGYEATEPTAERSDPKTLTRLANLISALDRNIEYKSLRACVECEFFIKFLKDRLDNPKSQDELSQRLKKNFCRKLQEQELSYSCMTMVDNEAPTIFKAVAGMLNPRAACVELGVCEAKNPVSIFRIEGNSLTSSVSSVLPMLVVPQLELSNRPNVVENRLSTRPLELRGQMCDQCIDIITSIDDYLSHHPVDQDVSVLVDKVCNKLPEGSVRSECTYIIQLFGADIVQAVSSMQNPRQLCTKIYLCSTTKQLVQ